MLGPLVASDVDDVAVALAGDHPGAGAIVGENRVGRDGGAVEQVSDLGGGEFLAIAELAYRGEHAERRVVRRRRHLVDADVVRLGVDEYDVGERPADIDSDQLHDPSRSPGVTASIGEGPALAKERRRALVARHHRSGSAHRFCRVVVRHRPGHHHLRTGHRRHRRRGHRRDRIDLTMLTRKPPRPASRRPCNRPLRDVARSLTTQVDAKRNLYHAVRSAMQASWEPGSTSPMRHIAPSPNTKSARTGLAAATGRSSPAPTQGSRHDRHDWASPSRRNGGDGRGGGPRERGAGRVGLRTDAVPGPAAGPTRRGWPMWAPCPPWLNTAVSF